MIRINRLQQRLVATLEPVRFIFEGTGKSLEETVDRAIAGDLDAVGWMYWHAHESMRAELMVLVWALGAPVEVQRELLMRVWDHEHHYLKNWLSLADAKAMFTHAAFPVPADVPETLTVYRGGFGTSKRALAAGFSWTTDRDTACFFAMRYQGYDDWHTPMVLKATIRRDEIMLMEPEHREFEVVIFGARGSVIDGDVADWQSRCKLYQAEEKRRWEQFGSADPEPMPQAA